MSGRRGDAAAAFNGGDKTYFGARVLQGLAAKYDPEVCCAQSLVFEFHMGFVVFALPSPYGGA